MSVRKYLVAIPTFLLSVAFMSQPGHAEWYISGNVGAVFVNDSDISGSDPTIPASIDGEIEFDTGFGINGAVGYGIGNVRLEGELSYRTADMDKLSGTATIGSLTLSGSGDVSGDVTSLGLMANVWYDIETGTKWVPFIGAGIGLANVDAEIEGESEDDTVFAYQVGAGIGYEISDSTTATLGYRYFATSDPDFDGIEAEVGTHNIEVGVRFAF